MFKKGIPQEGLKLIACLAMLLDHMAVIFDLSLSWRVIGRMAFPIYCFLLAEGAFHTRNPKKYALRLAIGAVISEFAFDFSFYGRCVWQYQSVMLTLLLGVLALEAMKRCPNLLLKTLSVVPFALLAALCNTDYGWYGVAMVALFGLVRELPHRWLLTAVGMAVLSWALGSGSVMIFGIAVPVQMFCLSALVPIGLYSGKKITRSKAAQWGFYLFYPLHMVLLRLLWLLR